VVTPIAGQVTVDAEPGGTSVPFAELDTRGTAVVSKGWLLAKNAAPQRGGKPSRTVKRRKLKPLSRVPFV